MGGAGEILRLRRSTIPRLQPRSPRSRTAGAGPGVRAALTFPPAPLPLSRRERKGEAALTFPLAPFRSHAAGAEGGGGPHLPPSPLPLPRCGSGRGRMGGAGEILRLRRSTIPRLQLRSPRSRTAGAGPGVRAALTFPPAPLPLPRCGSGRGRRPSPSPRPPFLSHAAGAEGGGGIAIDATQFTISLALQELLQQKSLKTTCRMHMRSMLWRYHRQGHGMLGEESLPVIQHCCVPTFGCTTI